MLGVAGGSHHVLLLLLVVPSLEPATRTLPICHLANLPFLDCLAVNKHSRPAALSDEFFSQTGMAVTGRWFPLWQWILPVVVIVLAVGLKLSWSRLPRWAGWLGVTIEGALSLWLLGVLLVAVVSNVCRAPRGEAASMLLGLGGAVVVLGAIYLRTVFNDVRKVQLANDALKRRIAADHPHDDVSVADDGSVTFKPRR